LHHSNTTGCAKIPDHYHVTSESREVLGGKHEENRSPGKHKCRRDTNKKDLNDIMSGKRGQDSVGSQQRPEVCSSVNTVLKFLSPSNAENCLIIIIFLVTLTHSALVTVDNYNTNNY